MLVLFERTACARQPLAVPVLPSTTWDQFQPHRPKPLSIALAGVFDVHFRQAAVEQVHKTLPLFRVEQIALLDEQAVVGQLLVQHGASV